MTDRQYHRLLKQENESFAAKIAALKADHARRLDALETVKRMSAAAKASRAAAAESAPSKGEVLTAVAGAVGTLSGSFTMREVAQQLPGMKRNSISSALRRLEDREEIRTVKPGRGKRLAIFERVPRASEKEVRNGTGG